MPTQKTAQPTVPTGRQVHTPTPWKVWPNDGVNILDTGTHSISIARALKCADAAFIIRAVNCHEHLLSIVRELRYRSFDPKFKGWDFKELDQVIAKAEGRE